MNKLILPPGVFAPEIQALAEPETEASDGQKAKLIPDPTGYRLLCVVPKSKDTFDNSSIIKADTVRVAEEQTSNVLLVIKVGPDAYKDTTKFPSGPWCKEGDFIVCRTYAGTRFRIFGQEFRLLNDDQIDAVVEDPRGIHRAGA